MEFFFAACEAPGRAMRSYIGLTGGAPQHRLVLSQPFPNELNMNYLNRDR